jgi:hypothetical protein
MKSDFGDNRAELRTSKKSQRVTKKQLTVPSWRKNWSSAAFFVNWPSKSHTPSAREKANRRALRRASANILLSDQRP